MKKLLFIIVEILILLNLSSFAFAEDCNGLKTTYSTKKTVVSDEDYTLKNFISLNYFPGYVHKTTENGVISYSCDVAAARDVLRFAINLSVPDDYQKQASDVNFDNDITVNDARDLLRYVIGLCGFPVTLHVGQEFQFSAPSSLEISTPDISQEGIYVQRETIPIKDNPAPGDRETFVIHAVPEAEGTYTLNITEIGYTGEAERTAIFDIFCIE